MKLFFVTREPDNWSDGDLRIVDPEAAAYSNTLDAANEAERLARTYPAFISLRAAAGGSNRALVSNTRAVFTSS